MPIRTEYLRTNNHALNMVLPDYSYRTSDYVEMNYFIAGPAATNWGQYLTVGTSTASSQLEIQNNFYGGRKVMNFSHGGAYSGDGAYSYNSPTDYNIPFSIVCDGNHMKLYKAQVLLFDNELGTVDNIDRGPIIFNYRTNDNQYLDIAVSSIIIKRNGIIIHNYVPIVNGGLYDLIGGGTVYTQDSGYIDGPTITDVYLVIFNPNSGSGSMPDQTIESGVSTPLNVCTYYKEHSLFIGWALTPNGTAVYDDREAVLDIAEPNTSITLYAVWEVIPGFEGKFDYNESEKNVLDKTLNTLFNASLILKDETSLIDPVFIVEKDISDLLELNYIEVPELGRNYFVNNIVSITNGLVELDCHVDVLTSYKEAIRSNTGVIRRQEKEFNLYLNDSVIKAYQPPIITTQKFPNGFTEQNFVLIVGGSRDGGIDIGDGGEINLDWDTGAGNLSSKTTGGLIAYAKAQLGNPYWFGTFGNIADQSLLDYKRAQYPSYYPDPGDPSFVSQFGERVHDCVGLVKGYRWSDTPSSTPVYQASEDVDVRGLYNQCIKRRGIIDPQAVPQTAHIEGCILFYDNMQHCGVYIGHGLLIEARGHAYGVVQSQLVNRVGFAYWGIPDWMQITTSLS